MGETSESLASLRRGSRTTEHKFFFFFHAVGIINRLIILPLFSACWFFSCFSNPPNSDMDYMISNARTWPFLRVRIHTGVGHTDSELAQHFWLEQLFLVRGSNLWSSNLEYDALPVPIEPPPVTVTMDCGVEDLSKTLPKFWHMNVGVKGNVNVFKWMLFIDAAYSVSDCLCQHVLVCIVRTISHKRSQALARTQTRTHARTHPNHIL